MKYVSSKLSNFLKIPKQYHIFIEMTLEVSVISLLATIIQEMLNQRTFLGPLVLLGQNPLAFFVNFFILASFYSIAYFSRRRYIGIVFVSVLWIGLGVANTFIQTFRMTPLTYNDFLVLGSVFSIINKYLSGVQIILFAAALVIVVVVLIILIRILPLVTRYLRYATVLFVSCLLSAALLFHVAIYSQAISQHYGNLPDAFKDYGFTFTFLSTLVDRGIKEPENYNDETIAEVIKDIDAGLTDNELYSMIVRQQMENEIGEEIAQNITFQTSENDMPNIIYVQLESFFDVNRLKAFEYNQDPIPNWTRLSNEYSSGYLTVPSIGAGTANTEFEILTGMSLSYFGPGEYPYKTVLEKQTIESIAYDLSEYGYHTQAIHNNSGSFYDRNLVYPNLGFDGFTSMEYMEDLTYTPRGWAKDEILKKEIMDTLMYTEEQDFVFTVTVQSHGRYPKSAVLESPIIVPIIVDSVPEMTNMDVDLNDGLVEGVEEDSAVQNSMDSTPTEETVNQYIYYLNQLHETDMFIGALVEAVERFDEPTIIVFYGDHLPSLNISDEDLKEKSAFQVPYLIWDNIGLEKEADDMMAYQLDTYLFSRLDLKGGLINQFHLNHSTSDTYLDDLELLQYDLLYGEKSAYDGQNPYSSTEMTMGLFPISITNVYLSGEIIMIEGEHFTKSSELELNGNQIESYYVDHEHMMIPVMDLNEEDIFTVVQVDKDDKNYVLSRSLPYVYVVENE